MRIDMHAHYLPPKALTAIEHDASSYGIHLEKAASGATCACFNDGLALRPFQPRRYPMSSPDMMKNPSAADVQSRPSPVIKVNGLGQR